MYLIAAILITFAVAIIVFIACEIAERAKIKQLRAEADYWPQNWSERQ